MPASGSFLDWLTDARDRLLASPRFRQWATAFPLTRPIARRRARELFDLCAGFVYSQVLLACVRLDLFDILAEGPQTADLLARRTGLPPEAMVRLLKAATSLRLVAERGPERFGLGPLGAAVVGNSAVEAMVAHHAMLYGDLADPVALLRGTGAKPALSAYWAYAGTAPGASLEPGDVAAYSGLMAASQPLVTDEILATYPLRRHRCLLDVGGGDGSFLAAAAAHVPHLRVMLFDLPPVAELARQRFAAQGLGDRATAVGGDFRAGALPTGADVATLVRVVHDHDDEVALALMQAVRQALPAGGVLVVAEPMAGAPGALPIGDAYFGFYLLAMGQGRARTESELGRLMVAAGFTEIQRLPSRTPLVAGLITGRVPSAAANV